MEAKTRGYALIACVNFTQHDLGSAARDRVTAKVSPELAALLPRLKHDGWYPREHLISLLRAIATEYSVSAEAHAALTKLGSRMAREMTNVFMRLVLRILTPALFAKKLPQLFAMDNRGEGRVEVDASRLEQRSLTVTFKGMGGYDFYEPVCEGWLVFFLESMGKRDVRCKADAWSLEAPGPDEFRLELAWS